MGQCQLATFSELAHCKLHPVYYYLCWPWGSVNEDYCIVNCKSLVSCKEVDQSDRQMGDV